MFPGVDVGGGQQVELELDVDVLFVLAVGDEPASGGDEVRRLVLQQAAEVGKLRHRPRAGVLGEQHRRSLGTEIGGDGEPAADGAQMGGLASEELEELLQISGLWPFHGRSSSDYEKECKEKPQKMRIRCSLNCDAFSSLLNSANAAKHSSWVASCTQETTMARIFLTAGALILTVGLSGPAAGAGPEMEPYGVAVTTLRIGPECEPHGFALPILRVGPVAEPFG